MGMSTNRLGVVEFAIAGSDPDAARIVAARIAVLDDEGVEIARWDWGSDRADAIVGEVAQTLRTLAALDLPLVVADAPQTLTVLDREARRRQLPSWDPETPVLDPVRLAAVLHPDAEPASLTTLAERHGVATGSLVAARLVRAMLGTEPIAIDARDLHARQRALPGDWPIVPLADVRLIQDTQPIPAPPLRPSDTVPMFDLTDAIPLALEAASSTEAPAPSTETAVPPVVTDSADDPVDLPPRVRRIHVAAAIVTDSSGRAVVVRKHGTTGFMQPGGKIERGESALTTLVRELREELGLEVDVDTTEFLGSFEAPALNEPGAIVRAEVFALVTDAELHPAAEIAELYWLHSPDDTTTVELAPLTLEVLLPLWAARRPALF